MNESRERYVPWLQVGAVMLVLAVLLPALAVVAFVGRFALLGAALAVLAVGAVAWAVSPRCREWLAAFGAPEIAYKGLRLATDVAVAPTHAWARTDRDAVIVGSDDLAPTVLGPLSVVELPEVGRWYQCGEPLAHLRRGNRSVALRAPVSGVVVGRNEALHWHPELLNDEPYGDGWLARMHSDHRSPERALLQHGRRARGWFRAEVDRLVATLMQQEQEQAVLADGGELVAQLHRHIDEPAWQRLGKNFFDGPQAAPTRGPAAPQVRSEEIRDEHR